MSCRMRPLDFFSTSPFPRLKSSRSCRGVRNCFRDFLELIWWLFKPMGTYSNSALRCSGYSVLKAKSRACGHMRYYFDPLRISEKKWSRSEEHTSELQSRRE